MIPVVSLTAFRIASLPLFLTACGAGFAQSADEQKQFADAQVLRTAGRYAEAETAYSALLQSAERHGRDSLFVSSILDGLAETEQELGNLATAERLLTRSLGIHRDITVESHLGELYLEEQRPREAETLLRRVLEARRKASDFSPVDTAVAIADLAMTYKYEGKFGQAEALLREALSMLEQHLDPGDPMLSAALGPLGTLLAREHKYREALPLIERTWRILSQNPRVQGPDLINTMSTLGLLYSKTGQLEQADFYGKEAVRKTEAIYGPDNFRLGWQMANYALILKARGRKAEAKEMQSRSAAILARGERDNPVKHTVNVSALR